MIAFLPLPVRGWRAALLLLVVACASPSRAGAECGTHVLVLAARDNGENPAKSAVDRGPESFPAPSKVPCSGPNCSRTPDHPTPPFVPVPTSDSNGKEATHLPGASEQSGGDSWLPDGVRSSRPISRTSSVFHPPRIG